MLKTTEAARYCGLSKSFSRQIAHEGDGPVYIKIGHSVRYLTDDLDTWIASRRRRCTWGDAGNDNAAPGGAGASSS